MPTVLLQICDFAGSSYGKKKMDSKKGTHYYVNRALVNRERGSKLEKAERWMKEIAAPYWNSFSTEEGDP